MSPMMTDERKMSEKDKKRYAFLSALGSWRLSWRASDGCVLLPGSTSVHSSVLKNYYCSTLYVGSTWHLQARGRDRFRWRYVGTCAVCYVMRGSLSLRHRTPTYGASVRNT
jgi:hypothetical protein